MVRSLEFSDVKVLCVGDVMLDKFVSGTVNRISPEGPVPVMSIISEKQFPGGAANVARNVAALGARCTLAGVVGDDDNGQTLRNILESDDDVTSEVVVTSSRPTSTKVRFIGQNQQILRVDLEDSSPISSDVETELLDRILPLIPYNDVVVLSDYAKGVLTKRVVSTVIECSQRYQRPVIVDPKVVDLSLFTGATIITPNQKEAQAAVGVSPVSDVEAEFAGRQILSRFGVESVLITRAERGMTLIERGGNPIHIEAEAREVFDVVGAGDTVIATLAVALGSGASQEEASRLANTAAGIVVGKKGTATVSSSELYDVLSKSSRIDVSALRPKVEDRQELCALAAEWRGQGLEVGFTNGCFDILHVGHVRLLQFARENCDRLIVGINKDESVKRLKGPLRPINTELDRAELISALSVVDAVVLFEEETPFELIKMLAPDVLVKGADYTIDKIVGADLVLGRGGRVLTFEIVPGKSTTATINQTKGRKD